jgi:hypothetical protein
LIGGQFDIYGTFLTLAWLYWLAFGTGWLGFAETLKPDSLPLKLAK